MDMSFMSKFLVQGRDAGHVLNHISANDVDGDVGRITYTQWLNDKGTLEADLTVTKLSDEEFMVVVTDTPCTAMPEPGCGDTCPAMRRRPSAT